MNEEFNFEGIEKVGIVEKNHKSKWKKITRTFSVTKHDIALVESLAEILDTSISGALCIALRDSAKRVAQANGFKGVDDMIEKHKPDAFKVK
jgi:hypothetical protein